MKNTKWLVEARLAGSEAYDYVERIEGRLTNDRFVNGEDRKVSMLIERIKMLETNLAVIDEELRDLINKRKQEQA